MHVVVAPLHLEAVPGLPQVVGVTVTNTSSVISSYQVRVLGADPGWVTVVNDDLSLFPDATDTFLVQITTPAGLVAGEHVLSVQVREQIAPHDTEIVPLTLTVAPAPSVSLRADPPVVTAGRRARLALVVVNEGNTEVNATLHGQDPDDRVAFDFDPPWVQLAPGQNKMVELRARARQPFAGSPVIRPLELRLLDAEQQVALDRAAAPSAPLDPSLPGVKRLSRRQSRPQVGEEVPVLALASFVQKPLVSRGSMSLVGLVAALTVFAVVIAVGLATLVQQSSKDRDLALKIAAAQDAAQHGGGSSLTGKVSQLTNGKGAANINVTVFGAADTLNPLATTVTGADGTWTVTDLQAGDYKAKFQGAGFGELWYPAALTPADAEVLKVGPGERTTAEGAALGGVPATISGTVDGDDVSGATLTLKAHDAPAAGASTTTASGSTTAPVDAVRAEATVKTVPIGADGTFSLVGVPSPDTYDLLVEKEGYASSVQAIDVDAGEERTGVEITLRRGDGVIAGTVREADGTPLPEATVVASVAQASVSTISQSGTGAFELESLPTPATLTVVISAPDHTSQTLTVALEPGQRLAGFDVTLARSSGTVGGRVSITEPELLDVYAPSNGGVLVTITDGTTTVQTATRASEDPSVDGTWAVDTLPVPGDYTVTYSRADLVSETVAMLLDAQGNGPGGVPPDLDVTLDRATGVVQGTVVGAPGSGTQAGDGLGEASVQLVSNDATYSVTSASGPRQADQGYFQFDAVPPGTYTLQASKRGVSAFTTVVKVAAGGVVDDVRLPLQAPSSLTVEVPGSTTGFVVELFRAADYPGLVYRTATVPTAHQVRFDDIDAPLSYIVQVRRSRGGPVLATGEIEVGLSKGPTLSCETTVADRSKRGCRKQ